jgi:hypothetical protein
MNEPKRAVAYTIDRQQVGIHQQQLLDELIDGWAVLVPVGKDVYIETRPLRRFCPHEGTYRSHDEGCYPVVYAALNEADVDE